VVKSIPIVGRLHHIDTISRGNVKGVFRLIEWGGIQEVRKFDEACRMKVRAQESKHVCGWAVRRKW
jgi:hypothetical protein